MKNPVLYWQLAFSKTYQRYRSGIILLIVCLAIVALDFAFGFARPYIPYINTIYNAMKSKNADGVIDFAPEVWLGLLGLVLGTLIIVISVASQSTPKLIDLYINDEASLLYIWYIVVGSVHNMFLQLSSKIDIEHFRSSMMLNTYFLLPIALLIAVPYVLYILLYTKTSNVINQIYKSNLQRLQNISKMAQMGMLNDDKLIATNQYQFFESLNQLDDLLAYVSFKEPKGDIMNKISLSIQDFIREKPKIIEYSPQFFKISQRIAPDVSFKTMTGQFEEMERIHTFYEQKGFRLLGNAYIKLIEEEEFDLASLCGYELAECGRVAIEVGDMAVVKVVLIRFNTLMRFGIKHGLKNKEARNLYNAIFHYSGYIRYIIQSKNEAVIKESCRYLNIYVNEIYRHSRQEPIFSFLVDAFTWEFKRILIELHRQELGYELQKEILGLFLKIDNLADAYEENPMRDRKFSAGVRGLQIALALYYLKVQREEFACIIIDDILQDHQEMDKEALRKIVNTSCDNLERSSPTFWEDTDRGNSNLYFSEDKDQIGTFLKLFNLYLNQQINNHAQNNYLQ